MGESRRLAVLFSLVSALAACGGGSKDSGGGGIDLHATPAEKLVISDLQGLQDIDEKAMDTYDRQNNGLFTAIFGGTKISDVQNYLNTRAHYFALENHIHTFQERTTLMRRLDADGPQVIAKNMGTGLFIAGVAVGHPMAFTIDGQVTQPVEVTDSHVGLVILAGGYTDKALRNGKIVTIPPLFRQMTLMHEARHSDCTGGISNDQLTALRTARTEDEAAAVLEDLHFCGHSHVICPSGDYKGMAACDNESWGAYMVGSVYAAASVLPDGDARAWNYAQMLAEDSKSRLLVPVTGTPDMSSTGLTGK
jgi:hypothetical protein